MEIKKAEILAEVIIVERMELLMMEQFDIVFVSITRCSGQAEKGVKEVGAGSSEEKYQGATCFSSLIKIEWGLRNIMVLHSATDYRIKSKLGVILIQLTHKVSHNDPQEEKMAVATCLKAAQEKQQVD